MNTISRWLGAAAAATLALGLAACSADAQAAPQPGDPVTVKVATLGLISDGALLLGMEQGFFEEEGLKIETSIVANPPAGLSAAQSGQIDIAYSPSISVLTALNQSLPLKVVAPADGYPAGAAQADDPFELDITGLFASAQSGITEIGDLAGKTIAVPARKAHMEIVIADELQRAGIDPNSGVSWVVLDFTSAVAALKSGSVDAAGLVSPFNIRAAEEGSVQISAPSVGFFEGAGATNFWNAGASTVQAKPEMIAAFQRALLKSNAYAMEHMDEGIQKGIEYSKSQLTPDQIVKPVWPTDLRVEDLDIPNRKMVDLGFFPAAADLSDVVWKG
ncbi:MAG: ABC transporter substrate-binding protein [Microbacterium sp.]